MERDEKMYFRLSGAQAAKLTDWPNEPDILTLKADLEAAKPAQQEHMRQVQKWRDLVRVEGSAAPPKIRGRSSVQPKLIRRNNEWRYSALTELFNSTDKLFKVEPVTFEDGPAARQNEILLNYQVRNQLNTRRFIDNYVRAAVDEGSVIVRVGWERETETVEVSAPVWSYYAIATQEEAELFQQALELKQSDPRTFKEQVDPALQEAVSYFEETGQPVVAKQEGEEIVEEERVVVNRPTWQVLSPANVYIDPSCEGDLDKALFVIVSFETNKAELAKYGDRYKNLDAVNWEGNTPLADPDHETDTPDDFQFRDSTRKKVVAYEYWGYYDIDGDGKLESIVATWIGDTLIRMEKNPFPDEKLPFVVVPYLPRLREIFGEPDAELLEDNQKIQGAVYRGLIDLLGRSANSQQGFAKGMLDPLNRRRFEQGQDYEFNPNIPPQQGYIAHKYPELPTSGLQILDLQNREAEALTGVKSFSGGLSGDAYGKVATGIRGMLDAASKREMAILRRLADGMIQIGKKFIAMNAAFLSEEEVVRITNEEFVTIRREDLKGNFDVKVDISTFEVDNEKAQDLGFMLQTLGPNMDPSISMMLLAEIAELKRMPVLAHRLRTWQPPPPDPVQQQIQQLEMLKLQKEIEKLDSEIQLNMAKARDAMSKASKTELDTLEEELGVKHARNIDFAQAQARGNQDLELIKAYLKSRKPDEIPGDITGGLGLTQLLDQLRKERNFETLDNSPAVPPINPNPNI